MSIANKIANKHFEEEAVASTASISKHGIGRRLRRIRRGRNRAALCAERRMAFKDAATNA